VGYILNLATFKSDLWDSSTATVDNLQEGVTAGGVLFAAVGDVVLWVVLLIISGVMDPWVGPGISGSGP